MYLLKIFDDVDLKDRVEHKMQTFLEVHAKFRDIMTAISNDSKLTSLLHKERGDTAFRILQGDRLQEMLIYLIELEVNIAAQAY